MTLWQFSCATEGFRQFHNGKSAGDGAPSDEDLERAIAEEGEVQVKTEE